MTVRMAISRTPYRVSFFGGGSDYPAWYKEHGGAVLSTAIDKYCFISMRLLPRFFDVKYRIVWSHIENVNSVAEILHPAIRGGLRYLRHDESIGLEVLHQGDLPARAGMGSSSTFVVGLIKAYCAIRDLDIDRHALALKAIDLEQNWLNESVGSQDQVAAAYGGLNVIRFRQDGTVAVEPVVMDPAVKSRLADHLVLVFTGSNRLASQIAQSVVESLKEKEASIVRMQQMVEDGAHMLRDGDLSGFGEMLHETWMLKRGLSSSVSNSHIDEIYATAREAGAIGGKLLGAGHSGFMLFFIPPERRDELIARLKHYTWVPFGFDNDGSKIIYQAA